MEGNERYVKGTTKRHDFIRERPSLALGQNPFAGILGCADSRVGPEYAFDVGRGDADTEQFRFGVFKSFDQACDFVERLPLLQRLDLNLVELPE